MLDTIVGMLPPRIPLRTTKPFRWRLSAGPMSGSPPSSIDYSGRATCGCARTGHHPRFYRLPLRYHGKTLNFIDTAGLRRRAKVEDDLEFYSTLRTHALLTKPTSVSSLWMRRSVSMYKISALRPKLGSGAAD
jgi:hypothetical protein